MSASRKEIQEFSLLVFKLALRDEYRSRKCFFLFRWFFEIWLIFWSMKAIFKKVRDFGISPQLVIQVLEEEELKAQEFLRDIDA